MRELDTRLTLLSFSSEGKTTPIRMVEHNGQPHWVGKDVCDVLGIKNHNHALGRLDEDERGWVALNDPSGFEKVTTVINEAGLYHLIITSRSPALKPFKRWVTHEVLPSLRQYGYYAPSAQIVKADRMPPSPLAIDAKAVHGKKKSRHQDYLDFRDIKMMQAKTTMGQPYQYLETVGGVKIQRLSDFQKNIRCLMPEKLLVARLKKNGIILPKCWLERDKRPVYCMIESVENTAFLMSLTYRPKEPYLKLFLS